ISSVNPPDYAGYARAAMEEGVKILETAGNNHEPAVATPAKHFIICSLTSDEIKQSAVKLGFDILSIDGKPLVRFLLLFTLYQGAGHPGEEDVSGLILATQDSGGLALHAHSSRAP
ncbi:hypothetical protein C8R45DRAFT_815588, partial [Mycena sanguinolenta]